MLFLNHPIYAIAVVLAGFLIFAGLGSVTSSALDRWLRGRTSGRVGGLDLAILSIIVLAIGYVFGLPSVIPLLVALPNLAKVAASLLLIAPLAFFMGMPFPLALGHLKANLPDLVPWAWGINGCASVISAVLATLLAMTFGFSGVVLLAAGLYAVAATIFRRTSAIGMSAPGQPLIQS